MLHRLGANRRLVRLALAGLVLALVFAAGYRSAVYARRTGLAHRIALRALVMGTAAQKPVSVDDVRMIDTSYPEFLGHMAALGAEIRQT